MFFSTAKVLLYGLNENGSIRPFQLLIDLFLEAEPIM